MTENFKKSLALILQHEGGFVNHKDDPGGMTNLGITRNVWLDWVKHGQRLTILVHNFAVLDVDEATMRSLTKEMVAPLYRMKYWDACLCDQLPSGVDYLVFDFAINTGPSRAIKTIQRALKITADGVIGPVTIKAIQGANAEDFITDFTHAKEVFYRGLSTFNIFGKGWLNRVADSKKSAEEMIV